LIFRKANKSTTEDPYLSKDLRMYNSSLNRWFANNQGRDKQHKKVNGKKGSSNTHGISRTQLSGDANTRGDQSNETPSVL
jgi:hypothetical protein